jgi:broad specificity phosphatase PhoE
MKGSMFFKNKSYKTCDSNKKDWRKIWKTKKQYALYDSSFLYPGALNIGAVPTKNQLLDETGSPLICPVSPIKSCEENKQDWQEYWYPEYKYDSRTVYPSDKNIKPIPDKLITINGKPCPPEMVSNTMRRDPTIIEPFEERNLKEISSIIVSHNTRIQCLLDAITQNDKEDKIRFMNCAILKLTVTPSQLYLSMVYQGDLSDSETRKISEERPYYVKEMSNPPILGHVVYPTISLDNDVDDFNTFLKLPRPLVDKKYTFYLVRHGQAQHNDTSNVLANKMHMVPDTSLTQEGIIQAKLAGHQLYQYLTVNKQLVPTNFFVSDLVRTHETMDALLDSVREGQLTPLLITRSTPIVLPCASELTKKGVLGNCDQETADTAIYNKLAAENYSKCSVNSNGSLHSNCNTAVDWASIYLPFYGGKVRGQKDTLTGYVETKINPLIKFNCRNTSMITIAIDYLFKKYKAENYSKMNDPMGGKRRTRRRFKR